MKLKNYFLFLFLSLLIFFSPTIFALTIKIPTNLEGAQNDVAHLRGEFYEYQVEGSVGPITVTPQKFDQWDTVEKTVANLLYAAHQKNEELFYQLVSNEVAQKFKNGSKNAVAKQLQNYAILSTMQIDFYFSYRGGFFVKFSAATDSKIFDMLFLKKVKNNFIISPFTTKPTDLDFVNISYFFNFKNFTLKKVELSKNIDQKKLDFSFELKNTYPYIHLLKLMDGKWVTRSYTQDNSQNKYFFDDLNPKEGEVRLKMTPENFDKKEVQDILLIESTYPLNFLPASFSQHGQIHIDPMP